MKIQNLKDVKDALKDIPDKVLEASGFNIYEDGVELMHYDEGESDDVDEEATRVWNKYPVLQDINNWVRNIMKVGWVAEGGTNTKNDDVIMDNFSCSDVPISSEENLLK